MAFSNITGQKQIKLRLAAEAQRRGSGAYMLSGPEGTGKRLIAEEFAKALMCGDAGPDGACGICANCKYFDNFTTPDVTRVYEPTDTKMVKVDFIKDNVVAESYLKPQFARTKTFIIDFDYLGVESQNALLKSLEEPRKDVVFILTSSNTDTVLDTVMSRVTEIKLDPYSDGELEQIVKANCPDLEESKVKTAVYNSGRIPGKAISLAKEDSGVSIRHEVNSIMMDILADPKGREAVRPLLADNMFGNDSGNSDAAKDAISDEMGTAMMNYLPLRGLISFGGNEETAKKIEELLKTLNS